MEDLKTSMEQQLEERLVEPNSRLGGAFAYLLKRWAALTRFLHIPGAPLDNNTAERAVKIILRYRKNSLFYKNQHGAFVGDVLNSLIGCLIGIGQGGIEVTVNTAVVRLERVGEHHLIGFTHAGFSVGARRLPPSPCWASSTPASPCP